MGEVWLLSMHVYNVDATYRLHVFPSPINSEPRISRSQTSLAENGQGVSSEGSRYLLVCLYLLSITLCPSTVVGSRGSHRASERVSRRSIHVLGELNGDIAIVVGGSFYGEQRSSFGLV